MPVRVLNGGSGSIANVANGIIWAANPRLGDADVINLSLGSPQCSETLFDALQFALSFRRDDRGGGRQLLVHDRAALPGRVLHQPHRRDRGRVDGRQQPALVVLERERLPHDLRAGIGHLVDDARNTYGAQERHVDVVARGRGRRSRCSKAKCPTYTPVQVRDRLTSTAQALGASTVFGAGLRRAPTSRSRRPADANAALRAGDGRHRAVGPDVFSMRSRMRQPSGPRTSWSWYSPPTKNVSPFCMHHRVEEHRDRRRGVAVEHDVPVADEVLVRGKCGSTSESHALTVGKSPAMPPAVV